MKASIALLLSGLAAQHVAATWNRGAVNYNTPNYNDNQCSEKQKGGYGWGDLKEGDKPGKYDGDINFGGSWTCKKSLGKRDSLTKRTFNSKCMSHPISKGKPATIGTVPGRLSRTRSARKPTMPESEIAAGAPSGAA